MTVTIGIDPHKATHVAVAIDDHEQAIGRVALIADRSQTQRLLAWAEPSGLWHWAGTKTAPDRQSAPRCPATAPESRRRAGGDCPAWSRWRCSDQAG